MYIEKTYKHKIDENEITIDIVEKQTPDDNVKIGYAMLCLCIIIEIVVLCIVLPYMIRTPFPFSMLPLLSLSAFAVPVGLILVGRHQKRYPKPPTFYRTIYKFDKHGRTLRVEKGPLVGDGQEFDSRKYKMKQYPFRKIHGVNWEASMNYNRVHVDYWFNLDCVYEGTDADEAASLHRALLRLKQPA
ncbi:MAG: hypothetical protein JW839_03345 [Candidatus Lokiarchaeota archaeon]|nr:hypothetical protein [Candidatus Lokiarchaeota archaeon]